MRFSLAKKLCLGLRGFPGILKEVMNVEVESFGDDRAGGDGAIGSCRRWVLRVTLK